jgi:hypothetical protein
MTFGGHLSQINSEAEKPTFTGIGDAKIEVDARPVDQPAR